MPLLARVLVEGGVKTAIEMRPADLRQFPQPPTVLRHRMEVAFGLFPCDLLFVHRDTEGQDPGVRRQEIVSAFQDAEFPERPHLIPVTPHRMMETWLLVDEMAIRKAVGNPRGAEPLDLPDIGKLEGIADPKTLLHELLKKASGLSARRRRKLPVTFLTRRVAEALDHWRPLRGLPAFKLLIGDVEDFTRKHQPFVHPFS